MPLPVMGSMEMEKYKGIVETMREDKEDKEMGLEESKLSNHQNTKMKNIRKRRRRKYSFIPRFGCMKLLHDDVSVAEKPDVEGSFNVEAGCNGKDNQLLPTHLIVMVNGIIGSPQNWRYAAKHFVKAYSSDIMVHCSESNSSMLTFDGIDVMGKRLADEVISVVDRHPTLHKISFIGHSLGGLVARYAIAVLYQQDLMRESSSEENGECGEEALNKPFVEQKRRAKIAGLEPVNFITSATPHLGSRGHKQVPLFCGFHTMEKAAIRASWLLGRTGKHLFLSDHDDGKPPLLLQMTLDSDDLKFISALESFKRRVAYANARFDRILVYLTVSSFYVDLVGWSSSSLRCRNELPKRRNLVKHAKYPHVINEDTSETVNPQEASTARGRSSEIEEAMLRGLRSVRWERVDVNFGGSIQRLLAHNTIQVKTYCINSHGADVIQHMIDNFQL
ncbi:hypothetical protein BUALT_Bualt08G0031900 [Buddleja alternifolia]|uniref:DUF676 domain-containing protein n=1 Tax=Buddleja alternifolia TaxID=168488 RepID=A0AAV6X4Q1_9LAMI|nr:hypothetical protein BUALT_Bualt08G0031900 [Buddleja alternifolia]